MKRALILVEGQTEESFVKAVLQEHFWSLGLDLSPTLLVTKQVKNGPDFKGGITTFSNFERDMKRLLGTSGGALVTMMLDYDGLPPDFPGMNERPVRDPIMRVTFVEQAIHFHFNNRSDFIPYLSLHEFEALIFASPEELPSMIGDAAKQTKFAAIRNAHNTPEDIDETDWPSYRIKALFPTYRKNLHGPTVAKRIGLQKLREECPHFNQWLIRLESFAGN
jgi:hypothetical protein